MRDARMAMDNQFRFVDSIGSGAELGSRPLGERVMALARAAAALHMGQSIAMVAAYTEHEDRSVTLSSPAGGTGEGAFRPVFQSNDGDGGFDGRAA